MPKTIAKQPIQKGEEYNVEITTKGHKGDGIAKIANLTVFVPETNVGDKVKIRITLVSSNYAFAEVIE